MIKLFDQSAKTKDSISQRGDFESLVTTVKMIVETQCDVNCKGSEFDSSGIKKQDLSKRQLILDSTKPFDCLRVSAFDIKKE